MSQKKIESIINRCKSNVRHFAYMLCDNSIAQSSRMMYGLSISKGAVALQICEYLFRALFSTNLTYRSSGDKIEARQRFADFTI